MDMFFAMLSIVALFAALLIPGYILGKTRAITDGAALSFSNVLVYIAMPFLVFSKFMEIDLTKVGLTEILLSCLLPVVLVFFLLGVCGFVFRRDKARRRAEVFCSVFPNCGFMGIPLAAAMWPDRPEIVIYISVFNMVSTFLLLTVGVSILAGDKSVISLKKTLASPIFFAIALGAVMSLLDVGTGFEAVHTYAVMLAQITTPLAMICLGYELSKLRLLRTWINGDVYLVAFLKLILSPLFITGVLALLKYAFRLEMDFSVMQAMLVATAVSTAASAPSLAQKHGADSEHAATVTLANTLLSVLTLPLAYVLLEAIF